MPIYNWYSKNRRGSIVAANDQEAKKILKEKMKQELVAYNPISNKIVFEEKEKCQLPDDGNSCIRLRGSRGNYVTLLPCGIGGNGQVESVDLCEPTGEVLYCGVPIDLVNIFIEKLGLEKIEG